MTKVLVVDDDTGLRMFVKSSLLSNQKFEHKFEVDEAFDGVNALEKFLSKSYDLIILDVDMPRLNGLETLRKIKEHNPGVIVIMVTAFASIENAVQAVKEGAYNFLSKPIQSQELLSIVEKALLAQAMISHAAASSPVLIENGRKFVGNNHQMQKVFNIIHRLSKVDTPVLIRGASGTGKELVARAIHFNSTRKDGKFVAINCSAIPENLFESELFGHEKGSFTGADQRKIGKFQFAEGGTLFLDEVGDLPLLMQVKLLRVLQEKVFVPVGSNREIPSNVRIIAATNRPLEEMMKLSDFREDLFYRLNVIPIFLPSLVDRSDDMNNLIPIFIKKFNLTHDKKILGISYDALNVLKKYEWPGNIRELENVIEHCFIMENSNVITLRSLPETILLATKTTLPKITEDSFLSFEDSEPESSDENDIENEEKDINEEKDFEEFENFGLHPRLTNLEKLDAGLNEKLDFNIQKEVFEKDFIIKALKTFKGRINQTALHANIPKKTLLRKIEKYGINAKDYSN